MTPREILDDEPLGTRRVVTYRDAAGEGMALARELLRTPHPSVPGIACVSARVDEETGNVVAAYDDRPIFMGAAFR